VATCVGGRGSARWQEWGTVAGMAARDGSAERKACVVKFGQSSFRGNFAGND
jgi:hypothetical protein